MSDSDVRVALITRMLSEQGVSSDREKIIVYVEGTAGIPVRVLDAAIRLACHHTHRVAPTVQEIRSAAVGPLPARWTQGLDPSDPMGRSVCGRYGLTGANRPRWVAQLAASSSPPIAVGSGIDGVVDGVVDRMRLPGKASDDG